MTHIRRFASAALVTLITLRGLAATPELKIKLAHGNDPLEVREQEQLERLAQQYDLKRYTVTRDIVIERGAIPHSSPVLTLNARFLRDDDLALSSYLHEQGHWVLMQRHRIDMQGLFDDLKRYFPNLPTSPPEGSAGLRDSYYHLVVCTLEWEGMEDLVGKERALRVIQWKQRDHYTAIYAAVMQRRDVVETIMKHYRIAW
jgi:hypothetical protein